VASWLVRMMATQGVMAPAEGAMDVGIRAGGGTVPAEVVQVMTAERADLLVVMLVAAA